MKLTYKLFILMVIMSFGLLTVRTVAMADWWNRDLEERPVLPREEIVIPTNQPEPTNPQPTQKQPTATPPKQGGPQPTSVPGSSGSSNDDPCASGKSYTGDYCGWSPRVGGDGGGGESSSVSDPGEPPVLGLSYTSGDEVGLSDIMLLGGLLCLSLYAKSKFAPNLSAGIQGKRRSR